MTATVENVLLKPTADIEAGRPYQVISQIQAVSFVQECADFAAQYPFRSFLIRVVLFILFIRVLLDIILEVYMIKGAFSSPANRMSITGR